MQQGKLRDALASSALAAGMHQRTARAAAGHFSPLTVLVAGALAAMATPHMVQAQQVAQVEFNIPAQPLDQALKAFANQSKHQVLFEEAAVAGRRAPALQGRYAPREALERLLAGAGIQVNSARAGVFTLTVAPKPPAAVGESTLAPVVVTAQAELSGTTEGTGSYTTGVTSTATKMNLSIRETPQSISVVTRQRMDDQELTSITKVLEQTPGITISRDAGERFNIISRGNEITKYQYDGLSTHVENQTQNMTQNLADMSIYDKIEIVRGATGLMTGAGYPSGVVNMVRKKPTKEFQASLTGGIGRWDDYRDQVDISGPLIEGGRLRARFVGAKQDNDTFTDYYSQKRDVLYGVAEADITNSTTLRFGIDYQKYQAQGGTGVPAIYTDGGQTNFSRSTTATSRYKNQELETTNYFFNIDQALPNNWKLVMGGNYMDVYREITNNFSLRGNTSSGVNRATGLINITRNDLVTNPLNQKSAAVNLQGPFSLFGREHQAIFGFEFSRYQSHWVNHYGAVNSTGSLASLQDPLSAPVIGSSSSQDFYNLQRGFYGVLRLNPVDKLHVMLGARASDYKYSTAWNGSGSGYKKSGQVTPYAGLVYDLTPQQSVYVSYTDIFMPNTVADINGKVIDPQIGSNYEAGWKGEFYDGRLNANVAIYQSKADNATELAGYHDSGSAYYRAVSGIKTKGIDFEVSGEVLPHWNVSGSYSHTKSETAAGVRRLPDHPLHTVKLWNTYRFSGDLRGLTIGSGARWISKTYANYPLLNNGKIVQDAYVVVDLMASYRFNKNLSASLNISNLLDKKYYTALGDLAFAYYGEPRNVRLSMRYDF